MQLAEINYRVYVVINETLSEFAANSAQKTMQKYAAEHPDELLMRWAVAQPTGAKFADDRGRRPVTKVPDKSHVSPHLHHDARNKWYVDRGVWNGH